MSIESQFEHLFKPEVRNAARELIAKRAVFLKIGTDTQIDASVRGSTPAQVKLRADSIESELFTVDCNCKPASRGQMCKHIWATLVLATATSPDFFSSKTTLVKASDEPVAARPKSDAQIEREASFKEKQASYRRESYQKQKLRAKELKASKKSDGGTSAKTAQTSARPPRTASARFSSHAKARASSAPTKDAMFAKSLPDTVQAALKYFEANGFPMQAPAGADEVNNAKRVLSRVFHPDKGGTHDEIVELLRHADTLLKYES